MDIMELGAVGEPASGVAVVASLIVGGPQMSWYLGAAPTEAR